MRSIFSKPDNGDLVLGRQGPFFFHKKYRVPAHARNKHIQIVGKIGKGKSKLLEAMIVQDIAAGEGAVIVIDPHSDLIRAVVANCLSNGILKLEDAQRVIYFDPTDQKRVIPFNVLAQERPPHDIAEQMVEAIRRAFPASLQEASDYTVVATSSFIVLAENNLNFSDLPRLLIDKDWRRGLLKNTSNHEALYFFMEMFEALGFKDQIMLAKSSINKVMQYTLNPDVRLVLAQPTNAIDFREAITARKIILIDLGKLPPHSVSEVLTGTLVLTSLEQAIMGMRNLAPDQRRPSHEYVDETQLFLSRDAKTVSHILSESRKMDARFTFSHQSRGQVSHVEDAFENVGTLVTLAVGPRDARYFADEMGEIDIEAVKSEPKTAVQHPQFRSIPEQLYDWKQVFKGLPNRQAYVDGHDGQVTKIWTTYIPPYTVDHDEVEEFLKASAKANGIDRSTAIRNIEKSRHQLPPTPSMLSFT